MKLEHLNLLAEVLKTPGLAVPFDKAKIAGETLDALNTEIALRLKETKNVPPLISKDS